MIGAEIEIVWSILCTNKSLIKTLVNTEMMKHGGNGGLSF